MVSIRTVDQFLILGVIFVATVNPVVANKNKIVHTNSGQVQGIRETTLLKQIPFYSFKGIPYANPPVGELRFRAPEPVSSWEPKVLDASKYGHICMQPGKSFPEPYSEDCLTLNIFVPTDVQADKKLSVLFFIHGGGFAEGSSNDFLHGPDFIVEKQTILVTTNYRLGVLGFLSLDSSEYSGNMGLKDQQLALKWVSENIGHFGGDNKRITILGHSAGGGSAHLQVLSTESRKYFRNAISMSGSANNYWSFSERNDHIELAYKIASDLGQPKNSYQELVEFLMTAPADSLSEYSILLGNNSLFAIPFAPVIERKDAREPFMVETPEEIYDKSAIDVDVWFTVADAEMLVLLPRVPSIEDLNKNFNVPLPFRGITLSDDDECLQQDVRAFYFGDDDIESQAKQYVDFLSDINFFYGIDKSVKLNAEKSKGRTFYSTFSVDAKLNLYKIAANPTVPNVSGASHGDDLPYLFRSSMVQSTYDEILSSRNTQESRIALQIIDIITDMCTNFAKIGEPIHESIDSFPPVLTL